MIHILSGTVPTFIIAVIGVFIKNKWLKSHEFWRGLEKLSYFLLFPAVLFNSILNANLQSVPIAKLIIVLIIAILIVASILITYQKKRSLPPTLFASMFQGGVRHNNYIFFALGDSLLGNNSMPMVSIIAAYMVIFTNFISTWAFARYTDNPNRSQNSNLVLIKTIATNPLIISGFSALILNYLGFQLHSTLQNTVSHLANSAFTIGMISIGAGLHFRINNTLINQIMVSVGAKLLLLPVITMACATVAGLNGADKNVLLLYSSLPCASTSYILAKQLGGDVDAMISIITFSTILSIFSISIMMYIFGS
ncbi:AEC family transporter [Rickettsiales endosymbiont of Paramecium tredecaurelia]|uniref:AEC family transporter n=1 Tax=Candidatus Sarmatiella mevalonica TaxID=2770581 RepID=UPI0019212D28|nr:AEC family transporter [Candidatus Sarmatiella mevalonica]MBL3285139.1 AEC family transporter [Candidatus Sarmatiella mevalonica]